MSFENSPLFLINVFSTENIAKNKRTAVNASRIAVRKVNPKIRKQYKASPLSKQRQFLMKVCKT